MATVLMVVGDRGDGDDTKEGDSLSIDGAGKYDLSVWVCAR